MDKIKVEPFHLIGIAVRTTNENNKAATDIAQLWGKFWQEDILNKIPNRIDNTIYSLYTDYEGDHTQPYTTIIGCKVKSLYIIPNEMVGQSFEGGNYVRTTAKGNLADGLIIKEWSKIWNMGLDRSFSADFEEFGEKAQNPSDAEINFFVAVK
jgi:predicted transcriptional regulator YdeE